MKITACSLNEARAELKVKSGSGDVLVVDAGGRLLASTGSGSVQLWTTRAAAVVKTGSGDVKIGDAGTLSDPADPAAGLIFAGRVTEEFKLTTGTFVHVGEYVVPGQRLSYVPNFAMPTACPVCGSRVEREWVRHRRWPVAVVAEREPGVLLAPVGPRGRFGEAGEGHHAARRLPQPAPPMRRSGIAHIGDARVSIASLEGETGRRHAPARVGKFAAIDPVPDDRCAVVRIDAGKWRQVTGMVGHGTGHRKDRGLALGEAVEIAHARLEWVRLAT